MCLSQQSDSTICSNFSVCVCILSQHNGREWLYQSLSKSLQEASPKMLLFECSDSKKRFALIIFENLSILSLSSLPKTVFDTTNPVEQAALKLASGENF